MSAEDGAPDEAGFEVTRFIPVPTSVSAERQAFLAIPQAGFGNWRLILGL